ncbi:uncharacterized protein BJ171DRAFT_100293 [Polychytrium aggregatum]|uniref:uncharacterized protein n=1 Tax=Polychytrium aggregatum TaxID=110093 RepID=UPI0022FDF5DF|nr:uncharacterized protein BJ171DRAFT_100293 [Polychytrium aggregatum]KAI9204720.1 hypothetical protein BJ171DRAFT_100293 [Polychytrium aggregatum]
MFNDSSFSFSFIPSFSSVPSAADEEIQKLAEFLLASNPSLLSSVPLQTIDSTPPVNPDYSLEALLSPPISVYPMISNLPVTSVGGTGPGLDPSFDIFGTLPPSPPSSLSTASPPSQSAASLPSSSPDLPMGDIGADQGQSGSPRAAESSTSGSPPPSSAGPSAGATSRKRKLTVEEKEEKSKQRALKNRLAAQESRDKKKQYIQDLEDDNASLKQQKDQLLERVQTLEELNQSLTHKMDTLIQHFSVFQKAMILPAPTPDPSPAPSFFPDFDFSAILKSTPSSYPASTTTSLSKGLLSRASSTTASAILEPISRGPHPLVSLLAVSWVNSFVYHKFAPNKPATILQAAARQLPSPRSFYTLPASRGSVGLAGLFPNLKSFFDLSLNQKKSSYPIQRLFS